jgi:hypothetical protein
MKRLVIACCFAISASAHAADVFVEAHAGALLGYGAEAGVDFGLVRVRGQFNSFDYDTDLEIDDNDFDVSLALDSRGVLVDLHPFAGAFHFTGGLYDNQNMASGDAKGVVLVNGKPAIGVSADADFSSTAPYVGIGWLFGRDNKGLVAHLEVGVLDNGDADVSLYVPSFNGAVTAEDVAIEEREMEEDLEGFGFFPVIKLGVGYYF